MTRSVLRIVAAGVVAGMLVGSARQARADDESGVLTTRHKNFESPQNFELEFRFSPYHARVDDDPSLGGQTPYANAFGTMPRLEIAAEFDWEVLRIPHVGTLGPGLSLGYTSMGAPAPFADKPGFSVENTNLDIFPMYLVAVFRLDVINREAHIPLVPYVKGGLGLAFWRAYNDGGTSSASVNGQSGVLGKGHTFGTHIALGLSFDLNALDQHTARGFDNAMGVNHTYIFGEMYVSALTGLGQSHAMYVGNGSFAAPALAFGLAFEF